MRDRSPTVSVSMIAYNQAESVGQAIDSVLMQEVDFDVELRIGDDCSTDGTRDVLRDYQQRYPDRIFLNLRPRRGTGVPGRENNVTTLRSCRGRYIAMLDGDDYWCAANKLQRQVDLLEALPYISACAHDSLRFDDTLGVMLEETLTQSRTGRVPKSLDIDVGNILSPQLFQTSSFCFRRSCLPNFPDWFMTVPLADMVLFHLVAEHGPIRYEGEPMSVYRLHDGAVYSRQSSKAKAEANHATEEALLRNLPAARSRRNQARLLLHRSRNAYEQRQLGHTAAYLVRLLGLSPRHAGQIAKAAWRRLDRRSRSGR